MRKTTILSIIFMLLTTLATAQQWQQLGSDIDGEAVNDLSGSSVSISSDGNTVAIGAHYNEGNGYHAGHVRIYNYNGTTWAQLGADIDGEAASNLSGKSVSLSADGNIVAIGANFNEGNGNNAGHVRIYAYNGTSWVQLGADIDGEETGDQFGYSVSLSADGNTVAIGAPYNDGNVYNAGHVRIYTYNGTSWAQLGADIDGEDTSDLSGSSVSLSADGNTVAIGAYQNGGTASDAGHVRIYTYNGTSWAQLGADIDGEAVDDLSGKSVSLSADGNIVAIGANENNGNGGNAGHVRIYAYNGTSWVQLGADIDGEDASDYSGYSVSLSADGNIVAIGAYGNDGNSGNAGHVRIYDYNGTSWAQLGSDIDGEAAWDQSGISVSLSADGNSVVIGANRNEGNGSNAGHARIYTCNSFSTINETACDTYTVPSGDETYLTSGIYMDTIPNTASYDSIITINLTIQTINIAVTQTGNILTADETGATYQWLDCLAMTQISGATNESYTATANGDYAVIVSNNGCSDTSVCYTVAGVGIIENDFGNGFLLYPNPTGGNFSIDLGETYNTVTITIMDLNGKLIQQKTHSESQLLNLKIGEPAGVYLLKIESGDKKAVIRLVKE